MTVNWKIAVAAPLMLLTAALTGCAPAGTNIHPTDDAAVVAEAPTDTETDATETPQVVTATNPEPEIHPSALVEPGMTEAELLSLLGSDSATDGQLPYGGTREFLLDGVLYTLTAQTFDRTYRLTGCRTEMPDRLTQLPVQVGDTAGEALAALGMTSLDDGSYTCDLDGSLTAQVNAFDGGKEILVTFPALWLSIQCDAEDLVTSVGWYLAPSHTVMEDRTAFRVTDGNLVTADGVTPDMTWTEVADRVGVEGRSDGEDFSLSGTEYRFDLRSDGQYHLSRLIVTEGPLPLPGNLSVGDSLETVLANLEITDLDPSNPAYPLYGVEYGQAGYAAFVYGEDFTLRLVALTESGAQLYVTFDEENRIAQADVLDPVTRQEDNLWFRFADNTDTAPLAGNVLDIAAVDDGYDGLRGLILANDPDMGCVVACDLGSPDGPSAMVYPDSGDGSSLVYTGSGTFLLLDGAGQSWTLTYDSASQQLTMERGSV